MPAINTGAKSNPAATLTIVADYTSMLGDGRFIEWLDITASKFYDWRERYGKVNEHNA